MAFKVYFFKNQIFLILLRPAMVPRKSKQRAVRINLSQTDMMGFWQLHLNTLLQERETALKNSLREVRQSVPESPLAVTILSGMMVPQSCIQVQAVKTSMVMGSIPQHGSSPHEPQHLCKPHMV